ncbi:MAG: hypothetical protein WDM92_14635 [Caulobacteraceae bacterium]
MSNLPVDPNSPVARDVAYASKHPGPYPKFASIPPIPTDVRPAAAYRSQVTDIEARQAQLDSQAAALPPVDTDTEAYAAGARSRAAVPAGEVPPPNSAEQTEAYAASLRERATPPPPPK